jgi:hypothetical protein
MNEIISNNKNVILFFFSLYKGGIKRMQSIFPKITKGQSLRTSNRYSSRHSFRRRGKFVKVCINENGH